MSRAGGPVGSQKPGVNLGKKQGLQSKGLWVKIFPYERMKGGDYDCAVEKKR
jgi:hypothetical protein